MRTLAVFLNLVLVVAAAEGQESPQARRARFNAALSHLLYQAQEQAMTEAGSEALAGTSANAPPLCRPTLLNLCLHGRFLIVGVWENHHAAPGVLRPAGALQLTFESGYFWFSSPTNMEAPVKMVNFCSGGQGFGVFMAGLTDFGVGIGVRDLATGVQVNYTNPPGRIFNTVIDRPAAWLCF